MNDIMLRQDVIPDVEKRRLDLLRLSGLLETGDDTPFDRVAELAREFVEADTALVSLVADDRQVFRGRSGVRPDLADQRDTDLDRSYCKYPVATGEPFVVSDARESALLRESPAITERGAISYAGVPLSFSDGTVLGTLCVLNGSPREWSARDLDRLGRLADLVQTELERQMEGRRMQELVVLAERLEDPLSRLGDSVRTVATMVEQPGDPRLARVTDQARHRLHNVEAISHDLASAVRRERPPADELTQVDVVVLLRRAVTLAGSAARPGDLDAVLPDHAVEVSARPRALSRGLALAVTTLLHHLDDGRLSVRLDEVGPDDPSTTVVITAPATELPAGELLRIAGHLSSARGEDPPLDVRYAGAAVRVRGDVVRASTGPDGTRLEIRLPSTRPR